MKRFTTSLILITFALFAVFAASVAWEGRAVVGGANLYPAAGMYGLSRVFSPGEIVEVLNPVNQKKVTVVVSGKSDLSGVLIVLSPEASAVIGVTAGTDAMVRVTKIPEYAREPDIINKRDMVPVDTPPAVSTAVPRKEPAIEIEEIPVAVPPAVPETKKARIFPAEVPEDTPNTTILTEPETTAEVVETAVIAEPEVIPNNTAELVTVPNPVVPAEKIVAAPMEPDAPIVPIIPPVIDDAVSQPVTEETVAALDTRPNNETVELPVEEEPVPPSEPIVAEVAPVSEEVAVEPDTVKVPDTEYEIISETTTYSLVETAPKPPEAPVLVTPEVVTAAVIPVVPLEPVVTIPSEPLKSGAYYVQLAFYKEKKSADTLFATYKNRYPVVLHPINGGYQCLIGPLSASEYRAVLDRFKKNGFADAFVKKIP